MYARSTTVHADTQRIDDGIAQVRDEVYPAVRAMEGFVGLSMLVDRETGRCIVTTAWESEEAMQASAERVRDMRERAADMMGGRPEVKEYEIALVHRRRETGDGAYARVAWASFDSGQADRILEAWRMTVLPQLEEMPGFCAVSLLADRSTGRSTSTVTFADRDSMEQAREGADAMRASFTSQMGIEITDTAECEVALAHLHVPELV